MRSRESADISEQRPLYIVTVAMRKKPDDSMIIRLGAAWWEGEERLDLRSEHEAASHRCVVEWLDAQSVSRAEETSPGIVPDRERKHAVEAFEAIFSPFDVRRQQHLGIGSRRKFVARRLEQRSDLQMVVDLAIEHDPRPP